MASPQRPREIRSVSVDLGIVIDPATDWKALDAHLDEAGANAVDLSAGRVEFTAFDWDAHPEVAAEPGTDHIARAARALREDADGHQRQIGLIVDAYLPRWIEKDPSIAGVSVDGQTAPYTASAYQLARGEVGDRLVEYVAALGARYAPSQIAITELFLDMYSYGDDDLALFREMTGRGGLAADVRRAGRRAGPACSGRGAPRCSQGCSRGCARRWTRCAAAQGAQIVLAMDVRDRLGRPRAW